MLVQASYARLQMKLAVLWAYHGRVEIERLKDELCHR